MVMAAASLAKCRLCDEGSLTMSPRSALPLRPFAAVAVCAAAVLAAGCSGGSSGSPSAAGGSAAGSGTVLAAGKALSLAADNARQTTAFSATMDITSSGTYASHLSGTLDEQTKPSVLAHQKFSVTANGTSVPGGMETLLTPDAVYLKMSTLARMLGKPWIRMAFSSLKSSTGANFAPLIRQLQANNPLAFAQMLPAASSVRTVGSQSVNGVPATEYQGTLDPVKALTRIDPSLRSILAPVLSATGITTDNFTVWVDGQHQIRKLISVETGTTSYKVTSVMVVTSVNQPLNIQVPPTGQTAMMPGM
jgi:hypothetical protein